MARKGQRVGALAGIAAVIGILLLALKSKGEAPPGPGGSPVVPAGAITDVDVAQGGGAGRRVRVGLLRQEPAGAAMGAHRVSKRIGDVVSTTVNWRADTKNSQGQPIEWVYQFAFTYAKPNTIGVIPGGAFVVVRVPNGIHTVNKQVTIPTGTLTGGEGWTVGVIFQAQASSPTGELISGIWVDLGSASHPDAFIVVPPASKFVVGSRVRLLSVITSFIGTVQELLWAEGVQRWEYFVHWDPGQEGNPTDTWLAESSLLPA